MADRGRIVSPSPIRRIAETGAVAQKGAMRCYAVLSRFTLVVLLVAGLMLPRVAIVLAEAAGFQSVVICRGDAIVRITLGADGVPVEAEIDEAGPCAVMDLPFFAERIAGRSDNLTVSDVLRAGSVADAVRAAWDLPPGRGPPGFV